VRCSSGNEKNVQFLTNLWSVDVCANDEKKTCNYLESVEVEI